MKTKLLLLFVLLLSCCVIGCSGHVGLSGKIVYSDNGEPVPMGEIQFMQPTFVARAPIREDGTFVTGSYKASDGLPPGTYGVAFSCVDPDGIPLVHQKYVSQATSGLSITIDKTTRSIEFKVDRPSKTSPER